MPRRVIKNLRILLTGASGGIGRALADECVGRGAKVLGFARRGELLAEWRESHANAFEQTDIFVGDVTRSEDRTAAIRQMESLWGGVDVVVNNAGLGALGRFRAAEAERLRQVFEVNFFAAVELTRAALPLLRLGTTPAVVMLGSILGHRATPQNSEYCASKFALRGWCESVRPELAREGIDLILISPGTTESEFYEHTLGSDDAPPWPNPPPIPAATVARAIIRALEAGKHEIIPSGRGRMLVWANRFFPGVVDRVMRKWG